MHQCSFCKDPIPAFDKPSQAHLVIGMNKEGHVHTHGDLSKKESARELLRSAAEVVGGLELNSEGFAGISQIVFNNKQRIGDSLMFTCAIRDFARAFPKVKFNVRLTAPHLVDHNP